MVHKKYVCGHSDDQNIFLIHIWSSSMIPVTQFLEFLSEGSPIGVLCYVNEQRDGGLLPGDPNRKRLEFQPHLLTPRQESRAGG